MKNKITFLFLFIGVTLVSIFVIKTYSKQPQILETSIPSPNIGVEIPDKDILTELMANGLNCSLENENGETVDDQCRVDLVENDYAKGTMPMAYWIAQKIGDHWQVVLTGNGIPQCQEVDAHSIPKEIFGNCIEASGNLRFQ